MTTTEQQRSAPYELFMLGLSIYVLVALALDTLVALDTETKQILEHVDFGICFIFLADFFRNLARAESKLGYLKWGWIDLLSSIPTVDALRVGRAARLIRVIRILRGFRSIKNLATFVLRRRAEAAFSAAALISILLMVFCAIAVLHVERGAESANIKTAGDALWWSYVTITTVGYGDRFPVTAEGRLIASILMAAGVGLFGTVTGIVATWFLSPGERQERRDLDAIHAQLESLNAALRARDTGLAK